MTAVDWLYVAAFGSVFGVAGQMVRVALGLRKLNQEKATDTNVEFSVNTLVLSLIYGALAGLTALIGMANGLGADSVEAFTAATEITPAQTLSVMAAGYAGADVIEGFVKNKLKPL